GPPHAGALARGTSPSCPLPRFEAGEGVVVAQRRRRGEGDPSTVLAKPSPSPLLRNGSPPSPASKRGRGQITSVVKIFFHLSRRAPIAQPLGQIAHHLPERLVAGPALRLRQGRRTLDPPRHGIPQEAGIEAADDAAAARALMGEGRGLGVAHG